jgi:hypothetical protein
VRYRLMATYRGSPFEAGIGPTDGEIVLFAACPPPEDLGFEPATGHWRKQLRIDEVQAVWESKPVGTFRGERCMVLDDLGDRLHIGYLGHDGYQAERLGYWQVDRGVFELVAPRSEVTDILEERTEYPRPDSTEPAAPGRPAAQPDYPPPGSPQDQARYLPPDGPQEQASYLLDRPGYFQTQPDPDYQAGSGYQPPPVEPGYGLPDRGLPDHGLLEHGLPNHAGAPNRGAPAASGSAITLPPTVEPPLPLEAAALRAATASRPAKNRPTQPAPVPPAPVQPAPVQPVPVQPALIQAAPVQAAPVQPTPAQPAPVRPAPEQAAPEQAAPVPVGQEPAAPASPRPPGSARARRSARRRLATERVFAELASLAGISVDSYAIGEEVEGALCLLQTDQGFEVFHSANGNRHELQYFSSEEAACFYLFGVLAADAVRRGSLQPAVGSATGQLPVIGSAR